MKYAIKSIECYITKDDYNEGLDINTFHSYRYFTNHVADDKDQFLKIISGYIGKDITENDLEIDGNFVHVFTHVSFKPNQDWNEFPIATDEEINRWKKGEFKLYASEYTFACYNLADGFELK